MIVPLCTFVFDDTLLLKEASTLFATLEPWHPMAYQHLSAAGVATSLQTSCQSRSLRAGKSVRVNLSQAAPSRTSVATALHETQSTPPESSNVKHRSTKAGNGREGPGCSARRYAFCARRLLRWLWVRREK